MTYPLTFYVDSLPDNHQGMTNGPVIRILKSSKGDLGLYHHELFHVKQWFATLGLHPLLYLLLPKYRLWSEVKAYKVQLKYSVGRAPLFASYIATRYNLDVSEAEALRLLTGA